MNYDRVVGCFSISMLGAAVVSIFVPGMQVVAVALLFVYVAVLLLASAVVVFLDRSKCGKDRNEPP